MAHEFSSGIYIGQPAWHRLGKVLPEDSDIRFDHEKALCEAGCCFEVLKVPTYVDWNGEKKPSEYFATIRTDTGAVLGAVGDRYNVLQTVDQFKWFQPFLDTREVAFETCIALRGGAVIAVVAKILRDNERITDRDHVAKYLLLSSSHDGSLATTVGFTPVRVECMNMLRMALGKKKNLLKIRHTANQLDALSEARNTIDLIDREFKATAEQYRRMAEKGINRATLEKYVRQVMDIDDEPSTRTKNQMDEIIEFAISGYGQTGKESDLTAWTAYQGFTQYYTHTYGRNAENRFYAGMFGVAGTENQKALDLAIAL